MTGRFAVLPDPLTPEQRRHNMSRIRSKNTRPELQLRRGLHAAGFRYRLHDRRLPGSPDMVLAARKAVIFVHGCFWHGHDCPLGVTPATRTEFWQEKLRRNRERDAAAEEALLSTGWRVLTVWECALRGRGRMSPDGLFTLAGHFLRSDEVQLTLRGSTASLHDASVPTSR